MSEHPTAARHPEYQVFGSHTFAKTDAELRDYWSSRTPEERMEVLAALRVRDCSGDMINTPLVRRYRWRKRNSDDYDPGKRGSLLICNA